MLINKNRELGRIFGDLRFIIIDEVHNFMGTDRGIQVLCQLERLQRFINGTPRRIGLSATLGDYTKAKQWLSSGTERDVIVPSLKSGTRKFRLAVEHFYDPPEPKELSEMKSETKDIDLSFQETDNINNSNYENQGTPSNALQATPFWEYVYDKTLGKKCIVFTNMRDQAEYSIAMLRHIAELRGTPDIYHVHHGSISAALRETAESEMKESVLPIVTAATLTLELGIDIGQLERILQLDAPTSVSSFLQRLGRSGRRGNVSEMWFVCREEKPSGLPMLPLRVPWKLLQSIAVIQLYIQEQWIESPKTQKYPLNMLYHQTMSGLAEYGEATPAALAKRVLGLDSFKNISVDDYKILLTELINRNHIQLTAENSLIVGLEGEKIVGNYKFFAVFPEEDDFIVMNGSDTIGKIEFPPPPGERMTIAGRTWEVIEVDLKSKTVAVKRVKGKIKTYWAGGNMKVDNRVLGMVKRIISERRDFPYLQKGAKIRLEEAYFLTGNAGIGEYNVVPMGGKSVCVFPWLGTVDYHTVMFLIKKLCGFMLNIKSIGGHPPYYITLKIGSGQYSSADFLEIFRNALNSHIDLDLLLDDRDVDELKALYEYKTPKFDKFIPRELLKKALIADFIDLDRLRAAVDGWKCSEKKMVEQNNE